MWETSTAQSSAIQRGHEGATPATTSGLEAKRGQPIDLLLHFFLPITPFYTTIIRYNKTKRASSYASSYASIQYAETDTSPAEPTPPDADPFTRILALPVASTTSSSSPAQSPTTLHESVPLTKTHSSAILL